MHLFAIDEEGVELEIASCSMDLWIENVDEPRNRNSVTVVLYSCSRTTRS